MTYRYRSEIVVDGESAFESPVNSLISDVASEMNGLVDRDNIGEDQLTADLCAIGFSALVATYMSAASVTVEPRTVAGWLPVTGMTLEIESPDCDLCIHVGIGSVSNTTTAEPGVIAVRLDGEIVACSDSIHQRINGSGVSLAARVPVSAGSHLVEVVVSAFSNGSHSIDLDERRFFVTQCRR